VKFHLGKAIKKYNDHAENKNKQIEGIYYSMSKSQLQGLSESRSYFDKNYMYDSDSLKGCIMFLTLEQLNRKSSMNRSLFYKNNPEVLHVTDQDGSVSNLPIPGYRPFYYNKEDRAIPVKVDGLKKYFHDSWDHKTFGDDEEAIRNGFYMEYTYSGPQLIDPKTLVTTLLEDKRTSGGNKEHIKLYEKWLEQNIVKQDPNDLKGVIPGYKK
jgi:hypothetical protein